MLKFIYKVMIISLICGSLTLLDFSSKGIILTASYAASTAKKEILKTDKVDESSMMATLTLTAVGLLTTRLYSCKLTTDMLVAAAGGASFIAGEVLSTLKLKKVMDNIETSIERDKKGNVNNEQKMALARLRMTYLEAKETAQTKKTLQQLAAVAFATAAINAYTMEGAEQIANASCTSALTSAATSCASLASKLAAGTYTAPLAPPVASGGAQLGAIAGVQATNVQLSHIPSPSSAAVAADTAADTSLLASNKAASALCTFGTAADVACGTAIALKKSTRGFCPVPVAISQNELKQSMKELFARANSIQSDTNRFSQLLNILIPQAHADLFSPLGIVASGAIGFLLATSKTLGIQIDSYLYSPRNRALVWGMLAGLAYMATTATDKVIGDIDSNVAKIDGIIFSYHSLKNGAEGSQTGSIKNAATTVNPTKLVTASVKYDDINLDVGNQESLPCFTGSNSKSCRSFEDIQRELPVSNQLDSNSQQQVSSILKAANAFNGTSKIKGASLSEAAKIGASANAINDSLKNVRKSMNERVKKNGEKENRDQMEEDLINSFNAAVTKNLKGSKAANMVASIYGGKSIISSPTINPVASEEIQKSNGQVFENHEINLGNTNDLPVNSMCVNEDKKNATPEEIAALNEATKNTVTIDDFEIKNDITKNTDTSLFDLISSRYLKSGYPRLFKIKEVKIEDPQVKK